MESSVQVTLTVVWLALMLTILGLNLPVGYVFWSTDQLRSPKNMYIASLLITDVLLALVIPLRLYFLHFVTGSSSGCSAIMYFSMLMVMVNVYSVLALTLARHRQIVSHTASALLTRQKAIRIIAFVWLSSIICSFRVIYRQPHTHRQDSEEKNESVPTYQTAYECLVPVIRDPRIFGYEFLVDYLLPLSAILFMAVDARKYLNTNTVWDPAECHKRRDCLLVRMIMVLTTCFFVLHGAERIRRVVYDLLQHRPASYRNAFIIFEVCQMLMFSCGVSNCLIYVIFNRRAAAALLQFIYKRQKLSQSGYIPSMDEPSTSQANMGPITRLRMRLSRISVSRLSEQPSQPSSRSQKESVINCRRKISPYYAGSQPSSQSCYPQNESVVINCRRKISPYYAGSQPSSQSCYPQNDAIHKECARKTSSTAIE